MTRTYRSSCTPIAGVKKGQKHKTFKLQLFNRGEDRREGRGEQRRGEGKGRMEGRRGKESTSRDEGRAEESYTGEHFTTNKC